MSTKATISYDETYHLFEECFDDEHIYLGNPRVGFLTAKN